MGTELCAISLDRRGIAQRRAAVLVVDHEEGRDTAREVDRMDRAPLAQFGVRGIGVLAERAAEPEFQRQHRAVLPDYPPGWPIARL
jgi:hypothetical protein